jgi:N-acetylneuraminate lyase
MNGGNMLYDMSMFNGVFVALSTIYDDHGNINEDAIRSLCLWYEEKGIDGLYICGSTGEGAVLCGHEREKMLEVVSDTVSGRLPVISHVGAPSTQESVQLACHAQNNGADAISAVPCIYYNPGEEGIAAHWNAIADAADLPFIIYNIPGATGYELSSGLFGRMLQNKKVCGIKNSSLILYDLLSFRMQAPGDFVIFNGVDEQFAAGLMMGADGGIGSTYGVMPELYIAMYKLIKAGATETAFALQRKTTWLIIDKMLKYPSLYGVSKAIISLRSGIKAGSVRMPLRSVMVDDPGVWELAQEIEELVEYSSRLLKDAGL